MTNDKTVRILEEVADAAQMVMNKARDLKLDLLFDCGWDLTELKRLTVLSYIKELGDLAKELANLGELK